MISITIQGSLEQFPPTVKNNNNYIRFMNQHKNILLKVRFPRYWDLDCFLNSKNNFTCKCEQILFHNYNTLYLVFSGFFFVLLFCIPPRVRTKCQIFHCSVLRRRPGFAFVLLSVLFSFILYYDW